MLSFLPVALSVALMANPSGLTPPSHGASCAADRPASVVVATRPEMPPLAALQQLSGASMIEIDLSDTGAVVGTSVHVSSGSVVLDRAALQAARSTTFAPEIHACHAVAGSYLLQVSQGEQD